MLAVVQESMQTTSAASNRHSEKERRKWVGRGAELSGRKHRYVFSVIVL